MDPRIIKLATAAWIQAGMITRVSAATRIPIQDLRRIVYDCYPEDAKIREQALELVVNRDTEVCRLFGVWLKDQTEANWLACQDRSGSEFGGD